MGKISEKPRTVSAYILRYEKKEGFDIQLGDSACSDSAAAARLLVSIYASTDSEIKAKEYCFALLLNRKNIPLGFVKLSEGGISQCVLDNKLVAKAALDLGAAGVILCHNHPSGDTTPGRSDLTHTDSLRKALNLMDIILLDHIILTEDRFFSFTDGRPARIPAAE